MKDRKIILYIATSQDGFIARKDLSIDWLTKYNNDEEDYGYKKFYEKIDIVIVGNTTQKQYPSYYDDKRTYVFSRKKVGIDKNITYVNMSVRDFFNKFDPKGNIWIVGGAELIEQFLENELINEYIITIVPEKIGEGLPLFKDKNYKSKIGLVKKINYGKVVQEIYSNK